MLRTRSVLLLLAAAAAVAVLAGARVRAEDTGTSWEAEAEAEAAAARAQAARGRLSFVEDFEDAGEEWVKSGEERYADQPVEFEDGAMVLTLANKHYGIARAFESPVSNREGAARPIVLQYEVKLREGLTCGGAYLKFVRGSDDGEAFDPEGLNDKTPYSIMFGPDRCGGTNKVHFILQHQSPVTQEWEEKHFKTAPGIKTDSKAHLYTLVVREDNSFEIFIDAESAASGNLLDSMEPSVNPPTMIDDPEDFKPDDWVDEAQIPDPEASKPDDWDEDAPAMIVDEQAERPESWLEDEQDFVPDPSAEKPDDWDDEEDGEWEAPLIPNPKCEEAAGCGEWKRPMIPNPDYKGKWSAPMIDNPDYKGEWAPQQIPNPDVFEDLEPFRVHPIVGVAAEVWTTNGGIQIDNIVAGHDLDAAFEYAEGTWRPKYDKETAEEAEAQQEQRKKELERKKEEGGLNNLIEVYVAEAVDFVVANPVVGIATAVAVLGGIFMLIRSPGSSRSRRNRRPAPGSSTSTDAAADAAETDVDADKDASDDADADGDDGDGNDVAGEEEEDDSVAKDAIPEEDVPKEAESSSPSKGRRRQRRDD